VPGGPLNLNSTNLPRPWSPRESSPSGKIPTVEPGIFFLLNFAFILQMFVTYYSISDIDKPDIRKCNEVS